MTNQARNAVRQALGRNPTFIVSEDMIQEFSDSEIEDWVTEINKFPGSPIVAHISSGKPRSATELNALTGHKCITYGTTPYEVVG